MNHWPFNKTKKNDVHKNVKQILTKPKNDSQHWPLLADLGGQEGQCSLKIVIYQPGWIRPVHVPRGGDSIKNKIYI